MVSNMLEKVTCPKCGETELITKFDRDVYIVRENDDFVRRKLYGCEKCKNIFTYDSNPRKESKNINISNLQTAFSKIAKQCEKVANNVTIK
jgi:hypothetical protein